MIGGGVDKRPRLAARRERLHAWTKTADVDAGRRRGVTTEVAGQVKALEREVRELRHANEISGQRDLRKASAYFAQAELGGR